MAYNRYHRFVLRYGFALLAAFVLIPTANAGALEADPNLQPQALNITGINELKELDPNLETDKINLAVVCRSFTYIDGKPQNDYRPNIGHDCFSDSNFLFYDANGSGAGISPHSTAICSILFGADPNAFNTQLGEFSYEGVIPQAKADIYEFWYFLTNNIFPQIRPEADVVSASIGSPFQDWWTRGIDSMAEKYGVVFVAGIGNGSQASDPTLYPAANSNVIGVGVVDSARGLDAKNNLANFSLAIPEHSSLGPASDNRCKPDIVAPGNMMAADYNEPNLYEPTGDWSSFSTPLVAATASMLVQKAKQEPNLESAIDWQNLNCLIRAILMNSAEKLPYWHKGELTKEDDHLVPLDYMQGAGMLNAAEAYKTLIAGKQNSGIVGNAGWDNNSIAADMSAANSYSMKLENPKGKFITATAVWNKHYQDSYPFEAIPEEDSNLRIELWAVDVNNPENDYLLDYSDSLVDNVEHIYKAADPNYTDYEIVISFSDINEPNIISQKYALAWQVTESKNKENIYLYDLNTDGVVDNADVGILMENYSNSLNTNSSYLLGDINDDGRIDINDLRNFVNNIDRKAGLYSK